MSDISCAFCMAVRPKPLEGFDYPAVTIINGQAVCEDHAYYVQGGFFNRILAIIRADEHKTHEACSVAFVAGPKSRSIATSIRRRLRG